jgi:hypothetical protein
LKIKLTYFFILFFAFFINAQQVTLDFEKGKCLLFRNNIYAYGFRPGALCIYKFDQKLKPIDSTFYIFSDKSKAADYLGIETDTLHQTLNFTLLKKDKLKAVLVRYNAQLKLINEFKKVEITKLDPLANFDQQKLVFKNYCYVVRSVSDTSGKQFYLSKFFLNPSIEKPFDYQFKWQFNFDKKFIQNIHLFYADSQVVYAYVHINNSERKGQWVLKINANNGLLVKAKKISNNQQLNYRFGNSVMDTVSKELLIMGQLTNTVQLASPTPTLFVLRFDSLMGFIEQKQVVQKISPANSKAKTQPAYVFQVASLKSLPNLNYSYQIDLFKQFGEEFKYVNTFENKFTIENEEINVEPKIIKEFTEVENFYFSQDKKDLNGKLYKDTTKSDDRFYYRAPVIPVKTAFKLNENEMPNWLLKKIDQKTNSIVFSVLRPGAKVYELKNVAKIVKENNPGILPLSKESYCLYQTKENARLVLEMGNW